MAANNGTKTQGDDDMGKVDVFGLPFRMALPVVAVGSFILALALAFCCYMMRRKARPHAEDGYKEIVVKKRGKTNVLDSIKYSACVICLEEFKNKDTLALCPCDHVFHKKCLVKWLRRRRTCPICMEEIRPSYVFDQSESSSRRYRGTPI